MGVAAIGLVVGFVAWAKSRVGLQVAAGVSLILCLGGFDRLLFSPEQPVHYGITAARPTVTLAQILVLMVLISLIGSGLFLGLTAQAVIFAGAGCVFLFVVWGNSTIQASGLIVLVTALLCFSIGRWLGAVEKPALDLVLAAGCFVVVVLQLAAVLAQSRGYSIGQAPGSEGLAWVNDMGRMVGLYGHPSILGKTTFLLLAFQLPLTSSRSIAARMLAQVGILAGLAACLFTLSRANFVASGVALVLWIIFSGKAISVSRRLLTILGVIVMAYANRGVIDEIRARNAEDPEGGSRSRLLEVGIHQISTAPWTGIGPNYYSEFVGQYDPLAASGFPVHNTYLLAIAELGLPLAAVFFAPVALTIFAALRHWPAKDRIDPKALTTICLIPGLLLITLTGWGMLSSPTIWLWFLAFGYLAPVRHNSRGYRASPHRTALHV